MDSFDSAPISVVMSSHNAASFVEETVESVRWQTYLHAALIVGHDRSGDEASGIRLRPAAAHPKRITMVFTTWAGPFVVRNRALTRAEGNFKSFLDADDTWHPDALRQMHAGLEAEFADVVWTQTCWQRSRIQQGVERRAGYSTASNGHHVAGHDCSFA